MEQEVNFTFSDAYESITRKGHLSAELMQQAWDMWLWKTPCNQALVDYCGDMNLNQGLGLLLCVSLSQRPVVDNMTISELLPNSNMVHLTDVPLHTLTQRQLLDQVVVCPLIC